MSNTILIKHGRGRPSDGILKPYELGYDSENKKLYIGNAQNKTEAVSVEKANYASQVDNKLTITLGNNNPIEYNGSTAQSIEITPESIGVISQSKSEMVNLIYPVGSIYMSVNNTSPATLFGGTWVQLKDKFLLGAGDSYSGGSTGGAATVTLSTSQIPAHNHSISASSNSTGAHTHSTSGTAASAGGHNHGWKGYYTSVGTGVSGTTATFGNTSAESYISAGKGIQAVGGHTHSVSGTAASAGDHSHTITASADNTGGGKSHDNMPPYLVVYMWKRTA